MIKQGDLEVSQGHLPGTAVKQMEKLKSCLMEMVKTN
jgi:hypothetical protein